MELIRKLRSASRRTRLATIAENVEFRRVASSTRPVIGVSITPSPGVDSEVERVWKMARNCAISPRQFVLSYCALAVASLSVAGACATFGAWVVLPFAAGELLVTAVLFLLYARHAADYDRVELRSNRLIVERSRGATLELFEFDAHWAQVHLQTTLDPKVEIRYAGQCVIVGSQVSAHRRRIVAGKLGHSLRDAGQHLPERP